MCIAIFHFFSLAICSLLKAVIILSLVKITDKINKFKVSLIKSSE